ncbi:hypothetical protein WA026_016991 [Henosepilachna vigintioctopunctata]|uniref:Uncharacterized protein n=1 Tax=Henosepilachna vigintioctopunctata TaxID=420089 RepID=A0AAW1U2V8_9CUCU
MFPNPRKLFTERQRGNDVSYSRIEVKYTSATQVASPRHAWRRSSLLPLLASSLPSHRLCNWCERLPIRRIEVGSDRLMAKPSSNGRGNIRYKQLGSLMHDGGALLAHPVLVALVLETSPFCRLTTDFLNC